MAKYRKKRKTNKKVQDDPNAPKIPKSFVLKSGVLGSTASRLVRDMRKVLEPNTATRLRERKNNKLKDFVAMAGPLGVTHMMVFTQSETGTNLKMARLPRGPTFTFRVHSYTNIKDITLSQKTPHSPGIEYLTAPLLVLNNFGNADENNEIKLMTNLLQSMFPQINISKINLKDSRRVVLFNYNQETKNVEMRHYLIATKIVGVSKSIKKIFQGSKLPNLSSYNDISDYVLEEAYASEVSDNEDTLSLPQNYVGRNNRKNDQRGIQLIEIGPRMELSLIKIESGLCSGSVLYHSYITKTEKEVLENEKRKKKKEREKLKRKKEQSANVERKKKELEEKENRRKRAVEDEESDSNEEAEVAEESDGENEYSEEVDESEGEIGFNDEYLDDTDVSTDAEMNDEYESDEDIDEEKN